MVQAVRAREASVVSLVEQSLARIDVLDGELGAFTIVLVDEARRAAAEIDARVERGEHLPLAGATLAVKDMIWLAGVPAASGSRALAEFVPDRTAVPVQRLVDAGAVIVGKTNMPEFGYRCDAESSMWGSTRNPWDTTLVPGGSSSGSAVALAAGMVALAVGTDAGGSIRMPSSYCGVVGHKPSRGLVPAAPGFGGWPLLGVVGPMARTVADAAAMLEVMAGYHPLDPSTIPIRSGIPHLGRALDDLTGVRVALSEDFGFARVEPEARKALRNVADALASLGAEIIQTHPATRDPLPTWMSLATGAIQSADGPHLGHADLLHPDTIRWIEMGADLSARDYVDAVHAADEITRAWTEFFENFDCILSPGEQVLPYPLGEEGPPSTPDDADEGEWWGMDAVANITGQPAIAVPTGLVGGLPVGFQLMGRRYEDQRLLAIAELWERTCGPGPLNPPL